jgi:hypothetical protein
MPSTNTPTDEYKNEYEYRVTNMNVIIYYVIMI